MTVPAIAGASKRRPLPPAELSDPLAFNRFVPDPDFVAWLTATFIDENGTLANHDHAHLRDATIGALWTNAENSRHGRTIVGQAEVFPTPGPMGKWQKARAAQQIRGWFGREPDFVLTFSAGYALSCDTASFCALVEHELYHCGFERDEFGEIKFGRDGRPKFAMRGHDVEEFVGVVKRYGAAASNASALVEAAKSPPEIGPAKLAAACGTCLRAAA